MRNFILGLVLGFGLGVSVMSQLPPGENTLEPSLASVGAHELGSDREVNLSPDSLFEVVKVVDGDTLDVRAKEGVVRLRLIGIDTPEIHGKKECYGPEASARAKALLEKKRVRIETDPAQKEDRYRR